MFDCINFANKTHIMKYTITQSLILLILLSCSSNEDPIIDPEPPGPNGLIWSDEFDTNGSPSSDNWTYDIGNGEYGWGNNEEQYYTRRNATVTEGVLQINAKRELYRGSKYTSSRLKTQGRFSFTYGRVEVRAKLPEGGGTWPAIWMLGENITSVGWPECGEIDIMEHKGNNPGVTSSAIHNNSGYGDTPYVYFLDKVNDVSSNFHTYGLNWTKDKIEFTVDDVVHYTYNPANKNANNWPFDKPQFIILNVAMGGSLGGNISDSFTSSSMEIDYVRVYKD
jgi:beta-glucanase (GH16 family)